MNKRIFLFTFLILFKLTSALSQDIKSPDDQLQMFFRLSSEGEPMYQLFYKGKQVVLPSKLGFQLLDAPALTSGFTILSIKQSDFDENWEPIMGEQKVIRNHYKELVVNLKQLATNRLVDVRFRLFNDGLGFRYEFPKQESLKYFTIKEEQTEFRLTGDHQTFWIPGDYDSNEYPYTKSKISGIPDLMKKATIDIHAQSPIKNLAVQTPLMMKTEQGLYINIHEAALINYPAMTLNVDATSFSLSSHLCPDPLGNKAYLQTEAHTPWRTIVVSDKATEILSSKLILNLNEPTAYQDVSWIKPIKYVGVWWEYFVSGKSTWSYSDANNVKMGDDFTKLKPNGRHGATTSNVKKYIDFAAKNGFDAVLVEGWNVGWEDWFGNWKENVFDFVTPYPDFDVNELQRYAASKNVKIMMHHETSASATNYERRLDTAFKFMSSHGYNAVKTGYVGRIIPRGEHHDSQWMINHYAHVANEAAKYKIMVNSHEAVRPTGLHRTFPNWIAQESARGTEFESMGGLPPEHTTILPFTRLMGGPMDYTPGIFQTDLSYYGTGSKERVRTTLVKQLAYYVTIYSPLQMAADLPENYERFPDAFNFIKDVAVDWDDTYILAAEPGDYISIARKAKNKEEWFVGAITDEQARKLDLSFSFLPKNKTFIATIYADGKDASWDKNPQSYTVKKIKVNANTKYAAVMAAGGGLAISIK